MAVGGDADRAIDWGERALRLSPFDPNNHGPCFAISSGHFQRGEYEAAAEAARKCSQVNPHWSYAHILLAATHAKRGRLDAAKDAAKRVLELEPSFTIGGLRAAIDMDPSIAEPLSEAMRMAGLPA